MRVDLSWIAELPKVELHTHLEGTLTPDRIGELADLAGVVLPRSPEQLFEFDDLAGFLELISLSCGLVRRPEDAERIAYELAAHAAGDGVIYQEVMLTPESWAGLPYQDLIDAVGSGFEHAFRDGYADCRILATLVRRQSPEEALEFVRWLGKERPTRVVGLGLEGDEKFDELTSGRFEEAYAEAGDSGFGLTAHTGESSGPVGARDALDRLKVTRLDHGIRAAEDLSLVTRLVDEGISCNVCLASNMALVYTDLSDHPLPQLVEAGVGITVNTDDWQRFGPLSSELASVATLMDWGPTDLIGVTRTAIDSSFCDPDRKAALHAVVDGFEAQSRSEEGAS
jgi:adenosine deaminase